MSATRPWVDAFADEMEAKLDQNRDKGDREGWQRESAAWLLDRLEQETEELKHVLGIPCRHCGRRRALPGRTPEIRMELIREECADIANFAMMIADVAGGLQPKDLPDDPKEHISKLREEWEKP